MNASVMAELRIYPYSLRSSYPGMSRDDVPVWTRFVLAFPDAFDEVAYSVRVGQGADPLPSMDHLERLILRTLTQRRIDVVGFKAGRATLIEVKPRLGATALGQLLVYRRLWLQDFPGIPLGGLMAVVGHARSEDLAIARAYKIRVVVV